MHLSYELYTSVNGLAPNSVNLGGAVGALRVQLN